MLTNVSRHPRLVRRGAGVLGVLLVLGGLALALRNPEQQEERGVRLYWLIASGLRADPERFALYRWAADGQLPHLAGLIADGTSGYSLPDFPASPETGFASLMSGTHPRCHHVAGVAIDTRDGGLAPAHGGAPATTERAQAPVWQMLAASGRHVALLSLPSVMAPPPADAAPAPPTDGEPPTPMRLVLATSGDRPVQPLGPRDERPAESVAAMGDLDLQARATAYVLDTYHPDVFVQAVDVAPSVPAVAAWPAPAAPPSAELLALYQKVDAILGAAMAHADKQTLFVLSSDRGLDLVNREVRLNRLFVSQGWLVTTAAAAGDLTIDWAKTRVALRGAAHVYINPNGLGGPYERALGPAYEHLRDDVIAAVTALTDSEGGHPLARAVRWEEAPDALALPTEAIGDLVLVATPGYGWSAALSGDGDVIGAPSAPTLASTQDARVAHGLWTPFVIAGPGVRRKHTLAEPVSHVDHLPTVLQLLGVALPVAIEGQVVSEVVLAQP